MTKTERPGLLWKRGFFNTVAIWEREPDVDVISKVVQETLRLSSDECKVSFLDAGAINRAYAVQVKEEKNKYIMRVSLPLDPKNKTASEVTTHKWLRLNCTTIPVPEIIAFDDSNKNPIGFEWILMEYMPGQCLYDKWRKIPWEDKIALVKKVVDCQIELMKSTFKTIGSLRETEAGIAPGHCVTPYFTVGDKFDYIVPRGPFDSSCDWIRARAMILIHDKIAKIAKIVKPEGDEDSEDSEEGEDDDDDLEGIEADLHTAERLCKTAPLVFPEESECTVLQHMDLSLRNMMVDENNQLSGIIDWEFAMAVPLWVAAELPKFLKGTGEECDRRPNPNSFASLDGDSDKSGEGLDNEGLNSEYWHELMDYETTQLRKVYNGYMVERLCPDACENSGVKNDYIKTLSYCDRGHYIGRIEHWLDRINKGKLRRFKK